VYFEKASNTGRSRAQVYVFPSFLFVNNVGAVVDRISDVFLVFIGEVFASTSEVVGIDKHFNFFLV
jgi:hypothetical protein